jgi:hypothetical protein
MQQFGFIAGLLVTALLAGCDSNSTGTATPTAAPPATAAPATLEPTPTIVGAEGPLGLFVIVAPNAPNPPSWVPVRADTAIATGQLAGPAAPARAAAIVPRFVDVGAAGRALIDALGLVSDGAEAWQNPDGMFVSGVFYGRIEPRPAMLQLSALTPTGPVPITRFPDTPIYDFRTSTAVNGNPTITKFPDKGTSDPNGDREIRWSQGGVAYALHSFGPITDEQLLAVAIEISVAESSGR